MTELPVFVTTNPSKAQQLGWHLGIGLRHMPAEVDEIQSLSLDEVVGKKVIAAYEIIQAPVLVEDTALVFHAMGALPGPFIKWHLQELGTTGLCRQLDTYQDRSATAMVLFGYYDGERLLTFSGEINGSIADEPRGERGFGWDPVFIPTGWEKTWGEMSKDEQIATSMRRIALQKLQEFLNGSNK